MTMVEEQQVCLQCWKKFSIFFGLKLSYLVFGTTEQVFHALQAKNTTVQEALSSVKTAEAFIQRQKSSDAFMLLL